MALKLTARQSQILALIRQAIATTGRPPTRAEIAGELGFRSANAAEDHLRALARKGMIRITAGTSRGIQLVDEALPPTDLAATTGAPPLHIVQAADQLLLPIVGRVAAGHPILAAEHVEREIPIGTGL
ncbi:MAG TPA: repressor LexA, partial [Castellaniella sp.]|nr:repressor LexA [Castellaniella sp.]